MARVNDVVNHTVPADEMTANELQLQTIRLVEKVARSQRALEERLDAMERLFARQGPAPYFPQFRRLPPEIRHRIWSLAIPTRVLRPSRRNSKKHDVLLTRPPAIAGACREARTIATQSGGIVSLAYDAANSENPTRTFRHWFDTCHDVLELDRRADIEDDEPRGIRDLVHKAQHILASRAEAEWFARLFQQTAHLKRLSLRFDTISVSPCTWDLGVVNRLFGDASTVITMDLENADEIAWVKGVLRGYWRNPVFCAFDLESWARERKSSAGTDVRDEGWMRRLPETWMSEVARGWVMAKAAEMTATVGGEVEGQGDMVRDQLDTDVTEAETPASAAAALDVKSDFVRAALLAMPDVKFVRAFCRDETHAVCRP
ncbi:uncharacterized protein ColSpa_00537 [Colletotrichum spaethianum]|uniref:2EXR domain-containing protein n=1 Tax=Colletotrichum spaethianum TaxID=700344 RepID=A0AA37P460_9PEZI|nr:uncharacterized protein ColSpa_00537 [Colletotrichum spaethianum]GKT40356.1 hypothetical protein ColSpa_00537 [Colletotrichum spaethianum]